MDNLGEELKFWLSTTFQNTIEHSLQLSANPAPEETPYVYKYQAIKNLKQLLQVKHPYSFIVQITLGEIYSEVEQSSDSFRSYEAALRSLSALDDVEISKFHNYLMILYNMLGLSYVNRQQYSQGMGCLARAYEIYESFKELKIPNVYNNRSEEPKDRDFKCYYQGGINHQQMEQSFTLTLFYLAQTYTKVGFKEKAAEHCGRTLQRQYMTNKFEIKQFCHNLMGLAEYYQGNNFYAEGQYLLMLALKVIPEGKKKKMRATIQISLGNLFSHMLQFCVNQIRKPKEFTEQENNIANRQLLLFEGFDQPFPNVTLASNLDACKGIFRTANTQYKKAVQVYVLDGFVTEHIDILTAQSRLYWNLSKLDKSRERVVNMLEKRKQLLEPLLTQLNPKAYPATWQKVLVQVSEIYNDLFQLKTIIAIDVKDIKMINEGKLAGARNAGEKLIGYYEDIVKVLEEDKETQKNKGYYRSIINSKFNIAKSLSKMYSNDKNMRVQYLKKSWQAYKELTNYINTTAKPKSEYEKELQMTQEMVIMLPSKIDRINYGQINPFE